LEENDQAIRIMTIHKSKGLEFPVVIHPFADYATGKLSNSIWAYVKDEELLPLDRLRLRVGKSLNDTPFEEDLNLEKSLSAMDMFNQLYVALTRAKDRLYVSGKLKKDPKKDHDPTSAVQFIRKHLLDSGTVNDEDDLFITGKRNRKDREETTRPSLKLETHGNPYWKDRIRIASPRSEADVTTGEASPRQIGIAIHDAMARIRTNSDIEQAVIGLVESGRTNQRDSKELEVKIQNLINRGTLKHLYGEGITIRNETDIQLEDGSWLRPDRVVTKDHQAWVLDYKTGEERPEHRKQIGLYKTALSQLGFDDVKGMLVYIENENVIEI
jgi:ATP-dependent exoDNAse (exonuclease V) beta subunit